MSATEELATIKARLRGLVDEVLRDAIHPREAASEADLLAARLRVLEMRTSHRAAQLRCELRELEETVAWAQ